MKKLFLYLGDTYIGEVAIDHIRGREREMGECNVEMWKYGIEKLRKWGSEKMRKWKSGEVVDEKVGG